jgi:hypothetical protein
VRVRHLLDEHHGVNWSRVRHPALRSSPTGIGLGITWGCPGLGSPPGWLGPAGREYRRGSGADYTLTRGRLVGHGRRGRATAGGGGRLERQLGRRHLMFSRQVAVVQRPTPPPPL